MIASLYQEHDYYSEHRAELLEKYKGKVLVIKGQAVIGVFDSEMEAFQKASQTHELGKFLIQECDPATQTYQSRVTFP